MSGRRLRNGYLARVTIAVPYSLEDLVSERAMLGMTTRILWELNEIPADGEIELYSFAVERVLMLYAPEWNRRGWFGEAGVAIRLNPPDVVSIRVNLREFS